MFESKDEKYPYGRKIQQMELKPGQVGSWTRQVQEDKLQLYVCYLIQTVPLNNRPSHVTQGQRQLKAEMSNAIFSYLSFKGKKLFQLYGYSAGARIFSGCLINVR